MIDKIALQEDMFNTLRFHLFSLSAKIYNAPISNT